MPKYFKREMHDLRGTGERQYYYVMRSQGAVDTAGLVRLMRRSYRVMGEGELRGMVETLIATTSRSPAFRARRPAANCARWPATGTSLSSPRAA